MTIEKIRDNLDKWFKSAEEGVTYITRESKTYVLVTADHYHDLTQQKEDLISALKAALSDEPTYSLEDIMHKFKRYEE